MLDKPGIAAQCEQKIATEPGRESARSGKQLPGPKPGYASERHLQAAGPVDSHEVGILFLPGVELCLEFLREFFVSCQLIGFAECDEVLMPVQFPDDLRITHSLKVQVRNRMELLAWGLLSVDRIAVPVDARPEIQVTVAEQVKTVSADARGARERLLASLGESRAEGSDQRGQFSRRKKETAWRKRSSLRNKTVVLGAGDRTRPIAEPFPAIPDLLPHSEGHFFPAHLRHPAQQASNFVRRWHRLISFRRCLGQEARPPCAPRCPQPSGSLWRA